MEKEEEAEKKEDTKGKRLPISHPLQSIKNHGHLMIFIASSSTYFFLFLASVSLPHSVALFAASCSSSSLRLGSPFFNSPVSRPTMEPKSNLFTIPLTSHRDDHLGSLISRLLPFQLFFVSDCALSLVLTFISGPQQKLSLRVTQTENRKKTGGDWGRSETIIIVISFRV